MHLPGGPQLGAQVFGLLIGVSPVGFPVLGAKTGGLPLDCILRVQLKNYQTQVENNL